MQLIFVDTETTGLYTWEGAEIFLYCVAIGDEPVQLWFKDEETTARFKALAEDPNNRLVWQNAVFDLQMLLKEGIKPANPPHDTMAQAHILHPLWRKIGLEALAKYILKRPDLEEWKTATTRWLVQNGFKRGEIWNLPREKLLPYATNDVEAMRDIHKILLPELQAKGLEGAYETECQLAPVLAEMKVRGVQLDVEACKQHSQRISEVNNGLLLDMFKTAGHVFNPGSGPQVGQIVGGLVSADQIPKKKTKAGAQCWDKKVLSQIDHPFVSNLLKFRALDKLRGTYFDGMQDVATDDLLHTSLNHLFTRTGRFSSSHPNLQNIPAANRWNPKDRGFEFMDVMDVKKVFPVREGYACWYFDYSQIELRLLAAYSRDKRMMSAYQGGEDLHTQTARAALGIRGRPLTPAERFIGKQINFAIVYGMGIKALSEMLRVSYGKARQFLINYHAMYPGVRQLGRMIEGSLLKRGFFRDFFGRLYRLGDQERYKAINYLIQGTAAGVMKNCMIKVDDVLIGSYAHMLLCVHDDLHVEIPLGTEEWGIAKAVLMAMEDFNQFKLPIKVDVKRSTTNWSEAKGVEL